MVTVVMKSIFLYFVWFSVLVANLVLGDEPFPNWTNIVVKRFQDGSSLHLLQAVGSKDLLTPSKEEPRSPLVRPVPVESIMESLLVIRNSSGVTNEDVPILAYRIPKVVGRAFGEDRFTMLDAVRIGQMIFLLYNNGNLVVEACAVKAIDRKAKGVFVPLENSRHIVYQENASRREIVLKARIATVVPEIRVEFEIAERGHFIGTVNGDRVVVEPVIK